MKRIRIPRKRPDVGWQIQWMGMKFPGFRYANSRWRGKLKPQDKSPEYEIEIRYRGNKNPKVYVRKPPIDPDAPHRYADDSLCLYFPPEWRWSEEQIIAHTIMPWTAFWLFCYEYWLEEREWYNDEAPHGRRKRLRR